MFHFLRSQVLQVRSTRSKAAWKRWDQIWLILKFISRLRVRIKFNRAADAIKQFIDSSWRGMHFRSKVGVYLANVRVLSGPQSFKPAAYEGNNQAVLTGVEGPFS